MMGRPIDWGDTGRAARFVVAAVFAGSVALACSFSPDLAVGILKCGTASQTCPEGYFCATGGYCCRPGDQRPECRGTSQPDGGAPDMMQAPTDTNPPPADMTATPSTDMGTPPVVPAMLTPKKILEGNFILTGIYDACTNAVPPTTPDRWCAAYRNNNFYAINVSQAARGTIRCDADDPNCRLLSTTAWTNSVDPWTYTRARFHGDVLIYSADATHNVGAKEAFRGTVYAWHPSWATPRKLTSAAGFGCGSQRRITPGGAYCFDRTPEGTLNYHAGLATETAPLPFLLKQNSGETIDSAFSRMSDRVFFSSKAAEGGPLFHSAIADIADPTKRVMLAPKVREWGVSADGGAVFYIRDDGPTGGPIFLVATATPTATPAMLAPMVQEVKVLTDDLGRDVAISTLEGKTGDIGTLKVLFPTNPIRTIPLGQGASVVVAPNRQQAVLSTKVNPNKTRVDAKLVDLMTMKECVLDAEPRVTVASEQGFSPDSRFVFWTQPAAAGEDSYGWLAPVGDCTKKRRFSERLLFPRVIDNGGFLFMEYLPGADKIPVLQYQKLNPDTGFATEAATLQQYVVRFDVVGADRKLAVYSSLAPGAEGIYLVDLP
jgi:hypothetical protein